MSSKYASMVGSLSVRDRGYLAADIGSNWRTVAAKCNIDARNITDVLHDSPTASLCSAKLMEIISGSGMTIQEFKTRLTEAGLVLAAGRPCLNGGVAVTVWSESDFVRDWLAADKTRQKTLLQMLFDAEVKARFGRAIGLDLHQRLNATDDDLQRGLTDWVNDGATLGQLAYAMRVTAKVSALFDGKFPELNSVASCASRANVADQAFDMAPTATSSCVTSVKPVSAFAAHLKAKLALTKDPTVRDFFTSPDEPHESHAISFCAHIDEEKRFRVFLAALGFPVDDELTYRQAVPDESAKGATKHLVGQLLEVDGWGDTKMTIFKMQMSKMEDAEINGILERWQTKLEKKLAAQREANAYTSSSAGTMRELITGALKSANLGGSNVDFILTTLKNKGVHNVTLLRELMLRIAPMQGAEYGMNFGEALAITNAVKPK